MTALKRAWRSWRKGLVGRVIEVNATTAKVELLTSKMLTRTISCASNFRKWRIVWFT